MDIMKLASGIFEVVLVKDYTLYKNGSTNEYKKKLNNNKIQQMQQIQQQNYTTPNADKKTSVLFCWSLDPGQG